MQSGDCKYDCFSIKVINFNGKDTNDDENKKKTPIMLTKETLYWTYDGLTNPS